MEASQNNYDFFQMTLELNNVTYLNLLDKIRADFGQIREMLMKISRDKEPSRRLLPWRKKRTRKNAGPEELLETVSLIIQRLDRLGVFSNNFADLLKDEKRLRDRVADRLMDHMSFRNAKVDYESLTQIVEEIYSDAAEVHRKAKGKLDAQQMDINKLVLSNLGGAHSEAIRGEIKQAVEEGAQP
ncbi:hypothetical protein MKX07_004500 [Trichoderma sp. CBMAI-0711]|uniref:Uncharacterized protein n=1 Tax=Trichoderma parareesei TaxID=858221 RepID=A0A2H2ZWH5_TRIPA|nr:hypothetical protein MKX07_004500 [Trichoderma sp. CBMAI-0711]OTA04985.1 hypothetical protein A9Z42_0055860 [Trichoderma parareesei]